MRTAEAGRFAWYEVDGSTAPDAATVIVLASGPGFSHRTLRPWLGEIGRAARLVFVELPGVGRGSLDPGQDYRFGAFADDLEAVRLGVGGGPVNVLGHGWGAAMAVEYAVRRPDAIASLILVSPIRLFAGAGQDVEAQARMVEAVDPTLFARYATDVWPHYDAALKGEMPWDAVEAMPWWGEMALTQFAAPPPPLWAQAMAGETWRLRAYAAYKGQAMFDPASAMATYDLVDRVAALPRDLPMLVIGSDHDANYVAKAAAHAQPIVAAHPRATLVRFDDAGHYPFVEGPAAFARVVRDFLSAARI